MEINSSYPPNGPQSTSNKGFRGRSKYGAKNYESLQSSCLHPTVMKDMCAECGADLRGSDQRSQTAAVAMVHNIPELLISTTEAELLGKIDEERLLRDRKLVLLVDLDQTLVHTTNDDIPANIEDVFHFQLRGAPWYHTRLRPFTKQFLASMSSLYELHICTFGSRPYAHTIASFLDEGGRYFSNRILSRDECLSAHSKKGNLQALFPCGDHMVVIIDDREDVWNFAPNLIHVRPYHFFKHTGDINAPPGLAKQENDDKEGYDFTSFTSGEKSSYASSSQTSIHTSFFNDKTKEDKISPKLDLAVVNCDSETGAEKGSKSDACMAETVSSTEDAKQEDQICVAENEENKAVEANAVTEGIKEDKCCDVQRERITTEIGEKKTEENVAKPLDESSTKTLQENSKIPIHDKDDYLLHLQDILQTIHHAYYELYDDNRKKGDESKEVPNTKIVVPYARRKVFADVRAVFSGVVPTNVPLEKSIPYLVAKSLGAVIMDRVTETTTHVIAARLGTAKLQTAKKYGHIHVVTPEWLWASAERWEHVEEHLYPLNSDLATVELMPPAHCTSADVAIQFIASGKEKSEAVAPVYDRVTGNRIFPQSKKIDKGKALAPTFCSSNLQPLPKCTPMGIISQIIYKETRQKLCEASNPYISLSKDDFADMVREVEEELDTDDEDDEETDDENKEGSSRKRKRSSDEEWEDAEMWLVGQALEQEMFSDD